MWILTREAFLSIVSKDCGSDELLVRARRPGDIEKLFPEAKVVEGGGTDYRCRAVVKRERVAQVLTEEVGSIEYSNFKNEVARHDTKLAGVLGRVWEVLLRLAPGARMG
jgi:hypothetical protein